MPYVTGRIEVYMNGELLFTKTGAKASGIGRSGADKKGPPTRRKMVMADSGIVGVVEEIIPARCEITLVDTDIKDLQDFMDILENGTILFRRAGNKGKAYKMIEATCLGDIAVTGGEGDTDVVFEGRYWEEDVQ